MIVDCNPEFGIELALALPYAYWLHEQGKLEKVITSKGMKPFYYFCDDVEEKYEYRTIDNGASAITTTGTIASTPPAVSISTAKLPTLPVSQTDIRTQDFLQRYGYGQKQAWNVSNTLSSGGANSTQLDILRGFSPYAGVPASGGGIRY